MDRRDFLRGLAALGVAGYAHAQSPVESAAISLKQLAADKGLNFGSCLALKYCVQSPTYEQLFLAQCDLATPELHMKWNSLSHEPGIYDFSAADKFVAFCAGNRIQVRGHTLIWHDALPVWVTEKLASESGQTAGSEGGRAMMTGHIQTVAGHFRGKLYSWDVVNEVLDPGSHRSDGLRVSPWLQACGEDYIELAFRTAAAADPQSLLIWNENYLEVSNGFGWAKRTAMLALLDKFKARGVPIHGIGIEAHLRGDQAAVLGDRTYEAFLAELARRGMKIFVTELDVQDASLPADARARDQAVADIYGKFLSASLRQPAVRGIVTWGLADSFTWIAGYRPRKDGLPVRPLPFDAACQPKPAYYAIAQALQGASRRDTRDTRQG
ncbi:MAG: endo-1,4-beta-xylanase [Acidobacteriaceae bacterium]